ncbi:MAG: hypothetical protein GX660_09815 [Clostridiaceae bacterium]|mgnify:CR=1 FL=1|nr:hypothetical protein [Clostridiaceae bacterium]
MVKYSYIGNDDRDDILAREIIKENTGELDPELSLVDDFLNEIELRLDQVKVYYPFMDLLRKRKLDQPLSKMIPELCFLLLSYLIYEGKLRHRGISFESINTFLNKALSRIEHSEVEPGAVTEITKEMLDLLQNGGRNFVQNIYSFKTGSFKEKYVKLLEIKQTDSGELLYYITEQGVDFYLKTKEFPDETKITINLLLFQKQMDKGAFGYAYETVRRLNMEVQKKKDKKYSLLEALMYGQMDSGEAYNNYHKSIVLQFEEESELFNAAIMNVRSAFSEYIDRYNSGEATEKEIRAFTLIKIIEKEIGRAQTLHTELLKEAVGFTKEYDNVLSVRRKAIFTERFNFLGEFERIILKNEKPEVLKFLFEPLVSPNIRKSFNPLRVLEAHNISKSKQEEKDIIEGETDEERVTMDNLARNRVRGNFVFYAARLLETLKSWDTEVYLKDFCSELMDKYSEDAVYNGDFVSFILEMNRNKSLGEHFRVIDFSKVKMEQDEELKNIEEVFAKAMLNVDLDGKINLVRVKSIPEDEVEILPGLKITNMFFVGEKRL